MTSVFCPSIVIWSLKYTLMLSEIQVYEMSILREENVSCLVAGGLDRGGRVYCLLLHTRIRVALFREINCLTTSITVATGHTTDNLLLLVNVDRLSQRASGRSHTRVGIQLPE